MTTCFIAEICGYLNYLNLSVGQKAMMKMSRVVKNNLFIFWCNFVVFIPKKNMTYRANNPGHPTGGQRTSHRSPTGSHDTFCGGQGWTTGGRKFFPTGEPQNGLILEKPLEQDLKLPKNHGNKI